MATKSILGLYMPILFLSNSGLHGDLLYSLISESLPFNWEKSEFGKQRHCLHLYEAVVVDCFSLADESTTGGYTALKKLSHPKILLINFSPNIPLQTKSVLAEHNIHFLCSNRASQKELISQLRQSIQISAEGSSQDLKNRLLLTRREQEILAQLTTGEPNSSIASKLHLSEHTVKNHMYNIFRKIGVKNRVQASNWAKLYLQPEQI
ncbi:response regulator transcription factor [Microbulbifer celer]|uniref:Response regulator transcription factor n=2 Tax=Microbulbifer celer TaxID=435905 RepID=A0ABW3U755_9GAMM